MPKTYHTHVFNLSGNYKDLSPIGSIDTYLKNKKVVGAAARSKGKTIGGLDINENAVSGCFLSLTSQGLNYVVISVEMLVNGAYNGRFTDVGGRIIDGSLSGILNYSGLKEGYIEITFELED
jgi:hypothetical protein